MDPLFVSESWIYRIGEAEANSVYKLAEQELATRRSMAMLSTAHVR
jgi:hypothetical protein